MPVESWNYDLAHSNLGFTVRHMIVSKVRGRFGRWSGTLQTQDGLPVAASIDIETASIDTNEPQRDDHLRSADFFDAASHPSLSFRSTRVEAGDDGAFRLHGDLTLRGVSLPVVLEAEYGGRARDPWGNERVGFSARATLNRKDWGLHWNAALETGGVLVGEKVELTIDVEATLAA